MRSGRRIILVCLSIALITAACEQGPRRSTIVEPPNPFLVGSGRTLGAEWRLYAWPESEWVGSFTPSNRRGRTAVCLGLWTHSTLTSCDLDLIPGKALVIAHSAAIGGRNRFLFFGAVDPRAERLVFRFADKSEQEQPLFDGPASAPRYRFFVAAPPEKGMVGRFDPIVFDADGREIKPAR